MRKKLLTLVLAIVMTFGCTAGTVNVIAADSGITISIENMLQSASVLFTKLENSTAAQRSMMFNFFRTYMRTDETIDTLIGLLDTPVEEANGALKELLTVIGENPQNKENVKFLLQFAKCFSESNRQQAFADLKSRKELKGISSAGEEAWNSLYNNYIPSEVQAVLENSVGVNDDGEVNANGITAMVILNALSYADNTVVFTDKKDSSVNFALKSIKSSFESEIESNLKAYSKINGKTWETGEEFIGLLIAELNSSDAVTSEDKENLKKVLGALDMYEKRQDESFGGNSGGSVVTKPSVPSIPVQNPNEPQKPGTELKPIPEPPAPLKTFADTSSHWAKNYIGKLSELGIIKGYDDGNYQPDIGITREDMATILVRALGLQTKIAKTDYAYSDGNEISSYSKNAINLLTEMGIFKGYEDGSFRPKQTITREEFCTLYARAMGEAWNDVPLDFKDTTTINDWAQSGVQKLVSYEILLGYEDNSFRPQNDITRAEAAVVTYKFLVRMGIL